MKTDLTAPAPAAPGLPAGVLTAIQDADAALARLNEALDNHTHGQPAPAAAPAQTVRACDVPVGGAFDYKGEMCLRISGKGPKTGKSYVTLSDKKPCKTVRVKDGATFGLNRAKVTYFPDATVRPA